MLRLPPNDPRNWYRQAVIHTLDCPHGNWWFVPWHRGYLGWFERICRDLSGDPTFALPYWDWTAEPRVPDALIGSVLDPRNVAFLDSFDQFQTEYSPAIEAYWNAMSAAQRAELDKRGIVSLEELWNRMSTYFFPRDDARVNDTFDEETQAAVSIETIDAALAPRTFTLFGSGKADQHSAEGEFQGILENQPHNLVHNQLGGFMGQFLSPVDPAFFMHHSNIDRLWDVWTRKQIANGDPTLPTGSDLEPWSNEPFLFFVDDQGQPVSQNTAGDYAEIGSFDYDYEPGSGSGVVRRHSAPLLAAGNKIYRGRIATGLMNLAQPAACDITVSKSLLQAGSSEDGPTVYARVEIREQGGTGGVRYNVLLNAPSGVQSVGFNSPSYVATLERFGSKHHAGKPTTFLVPLSGALRSLREAGDLEFNEPLQIQVVTDHRGMALQSIEASVESVTIGAF